MTKTEKPMAPAGVTTGTVAALGGATVLLPFAE